MNTSTEKIPSNRSSGSSASKIGSTVYNDIESYPQEKIIANAYNPKDDPNHPVNWPKGKKYSGLIVVSCNSFMGYFSSAVYMPATNDIMIYFNTSLTIINATIALFLLMTALAPLIWAPLSERIGRRWVYIVCMALYTVCTIICGISTKLGLFFVFRLLQGIFVSAGQAVGGGSVSDIFEPQDRGKAMSIYILGTILGPAIAPIAGGYIDQFLGWRWIFYIKTIMGGVLTICSFLFIKETLYHPDAEQPPPLTNIKERLQRLKFNPLGSLELLLQREVLVSCIPMSVAFGWFYFLVTILPSTFGSIYHFSAGAIGLCYVAGGIGNTFGSAVAGILSDKLYAKAVIRNGGVKKSELRFKPIYFGVPLMVIGPIMYGWFLHAGLHWIGPLIANVISCIGIMFTVTITSAYLVDANPSKAASTVAVANFTRSVCGMIFSLTAVQIRQSLGDGWSYTLMALMCLIFHLTLIPIVQKFGQEWREGRQ